ncbi:MAG TPA: site-2 protease family protein, partial [Chloroflexota bacterium]|nr:site-2 protease family protein [Chloroflexota bacterium]
MSILWFLPILSVMMFVHELGHFVTARLFGITVQEFGFGLPPRLWGFNRKGVIYSINWIPFGAFVKMLGEEDPT